MDIRNNALGLSSTASEHGGRDISLPLPRELPIIHCLLPGLFCIVDAYPHNEKTSFNTIHQHCCLLYCSYIAVLIRASLINDIKYLYTRCPEIRKMFLPIFQLIIWFVSY